MKIRWAGTVQADDAADKQRRSKRCGESLGTGLVEDILCYALDDAPLALRGPLPWRQTR
jgi:hypothetical protein